MIGVLVDRTLLPHSDRGHLFIGGPWPVLAYPISGEQARVMVDLPLGSTADRLRAEPQSLDGLPGALREGVLAALDREPPLVASNETRIPEVVVKGRVVLVGDAAGCCHPLSASGMASAVRDARGLETALGDHPHDWTEALASYARQSEDDTLRKLQTTAPIMGFRGYHEVVIACRDAAPPEIPMCAGQDLICKLCPCAGNREGAAILLPNASRQGRRWRNALIGQF